MDIIYKSLSIILLSLITIALWIPALKLSVAILHLVAWVAVGFSAIASIIAIIVGSLWLWLEYNP